MDLAKQCIDIGMFSNQLDPQLDFWQQEVGLPYRGSADLNGGMVQHRMKMHKSALKMAYSPESLPDLAPSGMIGLRIAQEGLDAARELADPDGNRVTLVPAGGEVEGIAVELRVNDADRHDKFFTDVMQFERAGDGKYLCGNTLFVITEEGEVKPRDGWRARGYRYSTIMVNDCAAEYEGLLARGATAISGPAMFGDVAEFAFVADPDGNHIELASVLNK